METTTTNGKRYVGTDRCPCCQIDTAGNHKVDCPMYGYRVGWLRTYH